MTGDSPRVRIGARLRQDAVGEWRSATRGEEALTVRILREDLAERDDARMLFEEEIRRIHRLNHPSLLRVHHVQRTSPRPLLVTDPIDGPTLAASAPLPAADALTLAESLVDGFGYLEARKQVHAAPVPERLVQVQDGWRLLTFRDIRAWDELKSLKGKTWPAPGFAPPEHAREHPEPLRPLPFLAWSLGALLRFAAGGGAPREVTGEAAPLPAAFPRDLGDIVQRLMAWEPDARPQGVPALQRTLAGAGVPPAQAQPGKAFKAPVPKRKRGRRS